MEVTEDKDVPGKMFFKMDDRECGILVRYGLRLLLTELGYDDRVKVVNIPESMNLGDLPGITSDVEKPKKITTHELSDVEMNYLLTKAIVTIVEDKLKKIEEDELL